MMPVRLIADDLTGALDAGACLASGEAPLPVYWHAQESQRAGGFGLDIETRELPEPDALTRLGSCLPELVAAGLALKKVDSLMRGNSVAELRACASSSLFRSVVIAPAFPAQGRVTRNGQQWARQADAGRWTPASPNLLEALADAVERRSGQAPVLLRAGRPTAGRGIFVCDAETEADLADIVSAAGALERPLLWCGTAGLARALGGPAQSILPPRAARVLVVIGSRHPMALAQIAELQRRWPHLVADMAEDVPDGAIGRRLWRALDRHGLALLVPARLGVVSADDDISPLRSVCAAVDPDLCIAAGGATLRLLVEAIGCECLAVEGEIEPGIAFSRMRGGRWAGAALISKAGAFGRPGTLCDLAVALRGDVLKRKDMT
jgi:uncharacterized protein YgbK (DUF1537 family)